MPFRSLLLALSWLCIGSTWAAQPLSLNTALRMALSSNPEISAAQAKAEAEHAAIKSESFLDDPHFGLMHEVNMNFMEQAQGPMDTWFVSQDIKFPAKYFLLGKAQSARASESDEALNQKRLEVRENLISDYYSLFAIDRISALLQAQQETLTEIARTAESRYATGAVPQQDEMKAHVEQTELEKDIIMLQEERSTSQAMLNSVLGQETNESVSLPDSELQPPKLSLDLSEVSGMAEHHARHIREAQAKVEESDAVKSLAHLRYAPDFTLEYRRAFGFYANQGAYSASIGFTVPLWFFAKQAGEVDSASARADQAERLLEATKVEHVAEVTSLSAKVRSTGSLLTLYQTGLIPQATSTLNSSRSSYRAGRTSIIELLDSERSLYAVRIAYYRTLAQYVENIAKLETILGESVSSLPFGGLQ